ncbi:Nucleolar protein 12 like [Verticillium longisporum]|uniref:Nucleolar protein 12 n=2 Tax=Verticillium longisporum TaxID=100787 RepID=A0A8I2ZF26_VERLO|nr:Nucleolar protein 12 like [Verticillium longisporum]KAG7129908.1 Nucleolar protein 12 like [Verticillium longisporum]
MSKKTSKLTASSKAVDPTLDALFSSSAGPAKPHPKAKYAEAPPPRPKKAAEESNEEEEAGDDEDDEDMVDADADLSELSEDAEGEASEEEDVEEAVERLLEPPRKPKERKRKRDEDDLEGKYLNKLALEEEKEEAQIKRQKNKSEAPKAEQADDTTSDDDVEKEVLPVHESLVAKDKNDANTKDTDVEKASRTVFLANVAAEASTTKAAKKTLMTHLSTVLEKGEKIESIRFRSLAFSAGSMPKRAAYITHSLMEATTKSANAYVVYSTPAAARKACTTLNGSVVLDRHIRVDSVAHPAPTDHRRCVFVGNLGFVDDETVLNTDASGETKERKRNKVPSDIEEGLWRVFGKEDGKVESVRVIRDPKTRVGKGFAYVQFHDANDVEAALLLNEKKFPPMLPRTLRVTRAKAPHKTALAQERSRAKTAGDKATDKKSTKYKQKATNEELSMAGRASKLLGRSGALYDHKKKKQGRGGSGDGKEQASGSGLVLKTPEEIIFEGKRASANDGRPNDVRIGKKKGRVNKGRVEKKGRGAVRAAAWRKEGGKTSKD